MKKLFALTLCLFMLWLNPAIADDYDSTIDAAFDSGQVVFRQAQFQMPNPEECEIVLPPAEFWDVFGFDAISEVQLRGALVSAQYMIVSYTPDGRCGLGLLAVGDAILPIAVSPGRVAIICPTEERGVYNEAGMLGRVFGHLYLEAKPQQYFGMGDEGVIWSPSGHYFCIINNTVLLQRMQPAYGSPILVDTQTGEMFSVDSFSTKITSANGGCWLAGCFSADERYFYAMVYSGRYGKHYTLVRYDIDTCEATPCSEGFDFNGLPAISELRNGSLIMLIDAYKADDTQSLAVLSPDGITEMSPLSVQTDTWKFMARRLCYSAKSGWALMRGWLYGKPSMNWNSDNPVFGYGFLRMRPDDSLADGMDTVWMISCNTLTAEAYDINQIREITISGRALFDFIEQHMAIADMKLSPDGRYAAVLAVKRDNMHNTINAQVLIIQLEDMKTLPAKNIDIDENTAGSLLLSLNKSIPCLDWSEAGLLCLWNGLWELS